MPAQTLVAGAADARHAPGVPLADATRSVALLGPTNTGKTHKAVERMLEHESGMIGLPLRLLAREIYDRVSTRVGQERVALVTGEEKRVPRRADYWVCTTEAMPLTHEVDFVAVDEVQLATHGERGHVFTDRLLHARGRRESWFLGAGTMRPLLSSLVPAARQEDHPRLSRLTYAGSSKLSRLKPRSAVVAFSVTELYTIAAKLRRLRGGAAVVLGALSPRARNAQVAMFQAGEVDYLVATDAIGMGLNLDVDHVAFASLKKFDGKGTRRLDDAELAQIAGRAGRYLRDGSFGTLAPLELEQASAQRIELHRFDVVRRARYRNSDLDFSSAEALVESLRKPPPAAYLAGVHDADDQRALEVLLREPAVASRARRPDELALLWDVCQIPDFRKLLFELHVGLLGELFLALCEGPLGDEFLEPRVRDVDRLDGDVHTLVARMAQLRTWAFVANQQRWVRSHRHWQERLAALEDRMSDALHAALVESFVERHARPRPLRKPRQESAALDRAEPAAWDSSHPFAKLYALRDKLAPPSEALAAEASQELEELVDAAHETFELDARGTISAGGRALAKLTRGPSVMLPEVRLSELSDAGAGLRTRLQRRLLAYARDVVGRLLEPLHALKSSEHASLRAIAYQLGQGLGTALAADLEPLLVDLDDEAQRTLERAGVKVGLVAVYLPALLKAAPLGLRATLVHTFDDSTRIPPALGRPSYPASTLTKNAWLALGYVPLASRAARADLVERAAQALQSGAREAESLRWLGVPKPELARVARALHAALRGPNGPGAPKR